MKPGVQVSQRVFLTTAFALSLFLMVSCSSHKTKTDTIIEPPPLDLVVEAFPGKPYHTINLTVPASEFTNPKIYVYKGERRLMLVDNGALVRDFPISLGFNPEGDKYVKGDGKTPEGEFFIIKKNPHSRFYKSLGISYPAPRHAQEALEQGRISLAEYRKIIQAQEKMTLPPYNTSLGGAIFIHGGGIQGDWTEGCIALSNSIMDELFEIISVGVRVEILP